MKLDVIKLDGGKAGTWISTKLSSVLSHAPTFCTVWSAGSVTTRRPVPTR